MAETATRPPLSPLQDRLAWRRFGPTPAGVAMVERPFARLIQIAGFADFERRVAELTAAFGVQAPLRVQRAAEGPGATVFAVAPGKAWLLIEQSGDGAPDAAARAATLDLLALELSDARVRIRLSGPALEDALARLVSIDVARVAFPPGAVAQTGLHHVGVLVHRRTADVADVLAPTSWAASLWDHMIDVLTPLGVEIGARQTPVAEAGP